MDADRARRTLDEALARGLDAIRRAATPEEVDQAETEALGRRAPISDVQRSLGGFHEEVRRDLGRAVNQAFGTLRDALAERRAGLRAQVEQGMAEADAIDWTLPGRRPPRGGLHVITQTEREITDVFVSLGYRLMEAPELETDWYNFTSLNMPPDHPARTMQDTLYPEVPGRDDLVLRTQTSNQQVRTMETHDPPIYVVSPGRCYRHDVTDATHSPVFQQIEILAVDEGLSLADMKGTLEQFARAMFGPDQRVQLYPDYFPFVEPGAGVRVSCFVCGGTGCPTCGNGWIEIMGAGMVHPQVLRNGGIDPERYSGFAAGMGIERIAMLRHDIPDIRLFYEGDVRFLSQFPGAA